MSMPSLSIVIPVFKQPQWIARTIDDAVIAVQRSGFERAEIVVVVADKETREALAGLTPSLPLRVLDEELPGRFAARQQGIEAATGELVLLLDSRISIAPDALRFVSDQITDERDRRSGRAGDRGGAGSPDQSADQDWRELPIWTAHFEFNLRTPYGRFWSVIIPLAWWRYYSNPRTTSFGPEDYDRFPKSTTCFLAPRALLLEAKGKFTSYFADSRHASDDTALIRLLADRQPINISPSFACLYTPHETYRTFMRNIYGRGKTFPDSYGRPGTRFFGLVLAYFPLSLLAGVCALRRPRLIAGAALAAPVPFALAATALRRGRATILAAGWVGPNWLAAMCAGLWYGLWLMLRGRLAGGGGSGVSEPS